MYMEGGVSSLLPLPIMRELHLVSKSTSTSKSTATATSDRLTSPPVSEPRIGHRRSPLYLQSPGSTPMSRSSSYRQVLFPPRLEFSMRTNNHISANTLECGRISKRSKENRMYCHRLFDAVDVKIHRRTRTIDRVRFLHDSVSHHLDIRVCEAEHGNLLGRVFFRGGAKVPIKDLVIEFFG